MIVPTPERALELLDELPDKETFHLADKIMEEKINLGKGKRRLVKGGKLNAKYQITLPEVF